MHSPRGRGTPTLLPRPGTAAQGHRPASEAERPQEAAPQGPREPGPGRKHHCSRGPCRRLHGPHPPHLGARMTVSPPHTLHAGAGIPQGPAGLPPLLSGTLPPAPPPHLWGRSWERGGREGTGQGQGLSTATARAPLTFNALFGLGLVVITWAQSPGQNCLETVTRGSQNTETSVVRQVPPLGTGLAALNRGGSPRRGAQRKRGSPSLLSSHSTPKARQAQADLRGYPRTGVLAGPGALPRRPGWMSSRAPNPVSVLGAAQTQRVRVSPAPAWAPWGIAGHAQPLSRARSLSVPRVPPGRQRTARFRALVHAARALPRRPHLPPEELLALGRTCTSKSPVALTGRAPSGRPCPARSPHGGPLEHGPARPRPPGRPTSAKGTAAVTSPRPPGLPHGRDLRPRGWAGARYARLGRARGGGEPPPRELMARLAGAVPAARFRVCIVSHILIIHEKASQSIPSMIPL